ncbi:hypothetical protein [Arthrobacter roseus]|uniref:hypothetical protein n=1 Tax=Arthrobacter roseus TaxID=136274 RepID=UPI0019656986|nr:hypothetical protein [Arthrobacter roseus]MBM7849230.1 tetratricopeptide (TPR) repeat protein [Arthrobacter roseus]
MADSGYRTDRLEALLAGDGNQHEPATPLDYLHRGYELAFADRPTEAIASAREALHVQEPSSDLRLRVLAFLISLHTGEEESEKAKEYLDQRLQLLTTMGRDVQHDVEGRLGLMLFREATVEELPTLVKELDAQTAADAPPAILGDLSFAVGAAHASGASHLEATILMRSAANYYQQDGNDDGEAAALMYLSGSLMALGDEDRAVEVIGRALELPATPTIHASMLMLRARTGFGTPSRALGAVDDAISALEIYQGAGIRQGAIAAAATAGQELLELNEASDAALALRIAADEAERDEHPTLPILRLNLGNALLQSEEFAGAISNLTDAQRLMSVRGSAPEQLANALSGLGHAQRHTGLEDEALATWEESAGLFEAAGQFAEQAQILLSMGTLLAKGGRLDSALTSFEAAVVAARREEINPLALPQALHTYGYARCESGDALGLVELDEAIELSRKLNTPWLVADFTDSRARALFALKRHVEAIACALEAADMFSEAGDYSAAGNAELLAGQVLLSQHQATEAEAILRNAISHMKEDLGLRVAAWTAISEALDQLGRPQEAEAARAEAAKIADNPENK